VRAETPVSRKSGGDLSRKGPAGLRGGGSAWKKNSPCTKRRGCLSKAVQKLVVKRSSIPEGGATVRKTVKKKRASALKKKENRTGKKNTRQGLCEKGHEWVWGGGPPQNLSPESRAREVSAERRTGVKEKES